MISEKKHMLVFLFILTMMLTIPSCSTITPSVAPTATVTPTATPIPEPEWSFFNTGATDDLKRLAFDQDGYLWVIGYGGVTRWDVDAGTYVEYSEKDGLGRAQREVILVDQDNTVWVAAEDGIFKFDGESWASYPSPSPVGAGSFQDGGANDLWLCGTEGLFQFDGEEWTQHGLRNGLPSDKCYDLALDPDGNPWVIAAENTLSHYTGQWENSISPSDYVEIFGNFIDGSSKIYISPNGELWIPNLDRVVNFDPTNITWNIGLDPMNIGSITAFTLSTNGTPWMACQLVGKSFFQANTGETWNPIMQSGYESGLDMHFNIAMADPDGAIWFMGEDAFIRTMQNEWTVFPDAHAAWNSFQNQGAFGEDGRLFFTAVEGILALGESEEDVTLYEKPVEGMVSDEVDELQIDDDGNVYALLVQPMGWNRVQDVIQVYDGAAWSTIYESNTYKPKSYDPTFRGLFNVTPVQNGYLAVSGVLALWAQTLDGMSLDIATAGGMLDDRVLDYVIDERGMIWVTHGWLENGGVSNWDGEKWNNAYIDASDAALKKVRQEGLYQAFLSPQGVLWFTVDEDDQWLVSYDDANGTWTNFPPDPLWNDLFGTTDYVIVGVQFNREDMPVVQLVDIYRKKGSAVYEYQDGVWNPIDFDGAEISTIRYDQDILWIGTKGDGVYYRDDGGVGEWEQLDDSSWDGGSYVTLIAPGADDDLWITTQESINLFREGTWIYFPQGEDGFIDVNTMTVAPDGAAWFGSETQGIARFGIP